jgi:putative ABC transport system substrate-binding protein
MPAVVFQTANMGRIRSRADDGGLISYGPDTVNQWRRAASYLIVSSKERSRPNLPVQAPTKYELIVNLKTAKARLA